MAMINWKMLHYLSFFYFALPDSLYVDLPYRLCDVPGNFAENTHLQFNINTSFLALSINASYHNFFNTSIGNGSDTVYSMFLCYNYTTPEACKRCIESATNDVQGDDCSYKNEAIVWEEDCQLRYSTQMFLGTLNSSGNFALDNKHNNSDPELFRSTVNQTLNNLTKLAAFNHSTMYATGTAPFVDGDMIYALVQCSLDLSQHDCQKCLEIATAEILESFYFSRGARLLSRSCYLRYELYAFYNGDKEGTNHNSSYRRGNSNTELAQGSYPDDDMSQLKQKFPGINNQELPLIDIQTIIEATDNFSDLNKLGEGGFGPVFKAWNLWNEDPPDTPCSSNRGDYKANSTFDNNLKSLLGSLPARAAQNEGFYNASVGDGADRVLGRALCRGDINSTDCQNCLEKASEEIKRQCQTREAVIRYDQRCKLEYGSTLLKRYNGKYLESNKDKKNVSADPSQFSQALKDLMDHLSEEAAYNSRLMFAAQSRKFSEQITIYGLVQCTRDLSNEECRVCLESASGDLDGCCGSHEGGTVYSAACSVRFEIYQFYYSATNGNKKSKTWVPVTIVCVLAFLMAVLVGSFARYRQKRKQAKTGKNICSF
nr:cysteine-rich receptor-like protein kinase 10 isoform X3 [Ipomoea trifida]